ncbi:MAG: glutaminase [Idiomarina sp.]|nr:glutaminase [Idiomarina sp.]
MTRDLVSGGQQIHAPDDLHRLLEEIHQQAMEITEGHVANYIPALAEVDPELCGLTLATLDGEVFNVGDTSEQFSIQSISKVFGLMLAMERLGEDLWDRVKMEPSGQAFNSIVQLEWEKGIPRNPMINAGAIVVSDVLVSRYSASKNAVLSLVRTLCGNDNVYADEVDADVDELLDHYFWQCALTMSCENLAQSFTFLANDGICPFSKKKIMSKRDSQRINALLSTSGMYDQSGEFAFTVGVPAKSGVGGGMIAVVPDFGVICTWSPRLNSFGNSARGMYMVRELANRLGLSVY